MNHGQGPLWLQSVGQQQQQRETQAWKIVFTIWGPGESGGDAERRKGRTAADRKGPIGGQSLGVRGPYGRQHFAVRFIAHLAVLINGKPVHRA